MSEQEYNMIFAKNLVKILERRGMTQVDLANELGVSESAVSLWCSGKTSPRMSKVDRMCELLQCSRNALMAEDGLQVLQDEDTARMLQDFYDKNHALMQSLADTTPEEIAQIQQFVDFVKSKR